MALDELKEELEKGLEALRDSDEFEHLFSDDDAERRLAEIKNAIGGILFYLKVSKLKKIKHSDSEPIRDPLSRNKKGLVKIRPCAEKYGGKTYLGFYIGDIAYGTSVSIEDDSINCEFFGYNPAIYIPEFNEIVYGRESWWGVIKSEKELAEITNDDIDNLWYVKALKKSFEEEAKSEETEETEETEGAET